MPKATVMVRFKRPSYRNWIRRPAVYGTTGRVRSGFAEFKDPRTGQKAIEAIGENFTFEIRVEDGGTTYQPAGKRRRMPKRSACRSQQSSRLVCNQKLQVFSSLIQPKKRGVG